MKSTELREMTGDELLQKLTELREAMFNLKFQHVTGQLENTAQITKNRKDIARIMTILAEKTNRSVA